MPKIKVLSTLQNKENNDIFKYSGLGILQADKIIYHDLNATVTISLNSNTIEMIRRESDHSIHLLFDGNQKTGGNYETEYGILSLDCDTTLLCTGITSFEIHYQVYLAKESMGEFEWKLCYEVIE